MCANERERIDGANDHQLWLDYINTLCACERFESIFVGKNWLLKQYDIHWPCLHAAPHASHQVFSLIVWQSKISDGKQFNKINNYSKCIRNQKLSFQGRDAERAYYGSSACLCEREFVHAWSVIYGRMTIIICTVRSHKHVNRMLPYSVLSKCAFAVAHII